MNLLSRITAWISALFAPARVQDQARERIPEPEAPVLFPSITFVNRPPRNEAIASGHLYCVMNTNKPKWVLFKCPCGCGSVVTLSLQSVHRPHWRLTRTQARRPTLYPSVWRDKGCHSHFWLRDGRVSWCFDTGTHPDLRRSH